MKLETPTWSEQLARILMGKIESYLLGKWVQYIAFEINEPTWLFFLRADILEESLSFTQTDGLCSHIQYI